MIRHIVILQLHKGNENYLDLLHQTRPLVLTIPGIVSYEIYENQSKYVKSSLVSFGVEIIFTDEEALEGFMSHPNHYAANALFEKYLADPPYLVLTHKI